jgi:predicted NUDIX family NTP pyrophosphohydrolase
MPQMSAGLLVYRRVRSDLEVLLVHPGGPFFRNRDDGWWTVPKGLVEEGEDPLAAARREYEEETGWSAPAGDYVDLGTVRQKSGKQVRAWAVAGDCEPELLRSNTFRVGNREFPEVDRAAFFTVPEARRKIMAAQTPLLDRLLDQVASPARRRVASTVPPARRRGR